MKRLGFLCIGLLLLIPSLLSLTGLRRAMPPVERLGYIPSFEVSYFSSLEYRLLLSEILFYNSVFYYGEIIDKPDQKPDYRRIYKYLATSIRLNPYNIDSYYYGQAVLTWDGRLIEEMNALLKSGVQKRTWDFYLPFFLGFNYSYFLNDYATAAHYTAIAGRLNPQADFLATLAGRFYYEANKTEMAIKYLTTVYQGAKNESVKKVLLTRINALERIAFLEKGVELFKEKTGHPPQNLSDLVNGRILKGIPADPYGGTFYFDRNDGRVKTTSNMTEPRNK